MLAKNDGGYKNMKYVTLFLLTVSTAVYSADETDSGEGYSGHSVMVGMNRFRQQLTFEQRDINLPITGQTLQYQYFSGDWMFGTSLSQSDGDDTESGKEAYQLDVDGRAINVFAERTVGQFTSGSGWIGVGIGSGSDEQQYKAQRSGGSGEVRVTSRFRSVSLDGGYSHLLESSRISVSGGLTQQWFSDDKKATVVRNGKPAVEQQEDKNEQALLAGVSAGLEKFWLVNQDTELAAYVGFRYQYTLGGDGQVQQSQLRRGARGVQQGQRNETFEQENDSATASTLRLSLFYRQLNLTLEVDKFSDQSLADAYYAGSMGLNF